MITEQQQLCCDAAERAEGSVAWVQGTVNVGALRELMHHDGGSGKSWIQEPRTAPPTHGSSSSDPDKASAGHVSAEKPDLGRGEVGLRCVHLWGEGCRACGPACF